VVASLTAGSIGAAAQERLTLHSEWGSLSAVLEDNAASRALLKMLPVTLAMGDHLRQEKTGELQASLPSAPRQLGFTKGTLGLWGTTDFVIYYKDGQVPGPGIIILGHVSGDVGIFDRPGSITVRVERSR
jgi:hypothetical protein